MQPAAIVVKTLDGTLVRLVFVRRLTGGARFPPACRTRPMRCYSCFEGIKGLGRSAMASRLAPTVVVSMLLLSMFIVCGVTAADAADPGFCRQYAKASLNQVRGGLANPACAGGLQGARWSSDFAVHYEWCLGASFGAAGAERDARMRLLRGCAGR